MKVLIAGYIESPIHDWLRHNSVEVDTTVSPLTMDDVNTYDWIVSYGYLQKVPAYLCEEGDGRLINLHISYLPWNRGKDPNLWSWIDDTPKGVTIHYIAAGIDTGDIIAQREVSFGTDETLATSYQKLRHAMDNLFFETWPLLTSGKTTRMPQTHAGTYHRSSDKSAIALADGYETKCSQLVKREH